MFGGQNVPLATTESVYYLKSYALLFLAGILGATPLVRNCAVRLGQMPRVSAILRLVAAMALLLICTAYLVDGSFNPFLYFRF
jgi:alginate O-acetyltransferase complex protein AlgI